MEQGRVHGGKRDRNDIDGYQLPDHHETEINSNGGDSETEDDETDDDEDDYGPSPAAGIWAGSKKLVAESEVIADGEYNRVDEQYDDPNSYEEVEDAAEPSTHKRLRL